MKANFRFSTKVTLFILSVVNMILQSLARMQLFFLQNNVLLRETKQMQKNCNSFNAHGKLSGAIQITWQ